MSCCPFLSFSPLCIKFAMMQTSLWWPPLTSSPIIDFGFQKWLQLLCHDCGMQVGCDPTGLDDLDKKRKTSFLHIIRHRFQTKINLSKNWSETFHDRHRRCCGDITICSQFKTDCRLHTEGLNSALVSLNNAQASLCSQLALNNEILTLFYLKSRQSAFYP